MTKSKFPVAGKVYIPERLKWADISIKVKFFAKAHKNTLIMGSGGVVIAPDRHAIAFPDECNIIIRDGMVLFFPTLP